MAKQKQENTKKQGKQAKGEGKEKKAKAAEPEVSVKIPNRLYDKYKAEIVPKLKEHFGYKNIMQVPKLEKIVVNMGVGDATQDSKILEESVRELETITGMKAAVISAKKSVSNFKLREGMKIGAKVTLRQSRMYEFLDRFINVALPRVRDFRGVSDKSFDGRGNYTMGVKEQIIFPEINVDKVNKIKGMDVTFVTTSKTDAEAYELLTAFGFPFRKKEIKN